MSLSTQEAPNRAARRHPDATTQSRLITPQQLADILGVSLSTAYRLLSSRAVPSLVVGRSIRIRPSALDAYISERERT